MNNENFNDYKNTTGNERKKALSEFNLSYLTSYFIRDQDKFLDEWTYSMISVINSHGLVLGKFRSLFKKCTSTCTTCFRQILGSHPKTLTKNDMQIPIIC